MGLHSIGTIISIILIMGAGASLVSGCIFFSREKNVGEIRLQLLIFALASFFWGASYGIIGFLQSVRVAQVVRIVGVASIDIFLLVDFFIVSGLTSFRTITKRIIRIPAIIISLIDFIFYARPKVDDFYIEDGFMTWNVVECFERNIHQAIIITFFVTLAILGIIAYKSYKLKRQKQFFALFYAAHLLLMFFSLVDTFYIFGYPLPMSGIGAIVCAIMLSIGAGRNNAFGISASVVYDRIYDFMNEGMVIFGENKRVVFANAYACSLLGKRGCRGSEISDIFAIDIESAKGIYEDAKNDELKDIRLNIKNSLTWCVSKMVCAKDSYGEPYCYILTISDITKEMKMLDDLSQANEAKSHFLTSISHEIRTPINSVIGMNEMIRRKSKDEEILTYTENIEKSGRHLLSVINDILDYTKIESGGFDLFNTSYNLANVFNNLYMTMVPRIEEKNLNMDFKINPATPSWLYGDEVRVNQIIANILGNAIKYTDDGFITLECNYEEIDNDNINLIISVRDSGRGIRNVKNSNLFDAFTRLDEKKNQSIEGTGLGLALTKSILDCMGGTIEVESIYGVGSRFTVSIPQRIGDRIPIGNVAEIIEGLNTVEKTGEKSFVAPDAKVLVVDDVDMNLLVVSDLLKNTKMAIDCVMSGRDAVKKCKENKYDVIMMDHMMPEMDGIECLKEIRRFGVNINTPVIVLTANAIVGMRDMYLREGFDDYLTKPIDGKKLEAMIKKYLPEKLYNNL